MPPIPPNILANLRKNCVSLRAVDPSLAERVEGAEWPEDLKFMAALDGTPTAFSQAFSRSGWFAATSAPKVRESILCGRFEPEASNVVFPGAGQGFGLKQVLGRLAAHQSIFVWEPRVLEIAVVLGLHDFSLEIVERRVIFLCGDDLKRELVEYIRNCPEIVVPSKMIGWPWLTEHRMQDLSLIMEQAVVEANEVVHQTAASLQERVDRLAGLQAGEPIRKIGVFALTCQPRAQQIAKDLGAAAKHRDIHADVFLLDSPMRSSGVSVLKQLDETCPQGIVSIGVEKKTWGAKVPAAIPFVTMLASPGAVLGEAAVKDIVPAENEKLVLGAAQDVEAIRERLGADNVLLVEVAVNSDVIKPEALPAESQIVYLADWTDPDPEKAGIRQKSHCHLWSEIGKAIAGNPLGYCNARAEELVDRVSNITGIGLPDKEVRDAFVSVVKNVLAPGTVALRVAQMLIDAGISVRIFGSGWKECPSLSSQARPLPTDPKALSTVLNSSDMVLYLDSESNWRQIVFDALCAGRPVLVRSLPEGRFAAVPEVSQGLVKLHAGADLVAQVRQAFNARTSLMERATAARRYLSEHHSYGRILDQIVRLMGTT